MNFTVNKKEFLDALQISSRAISSTTPLPSLMGIKLEVYENELILISSDSNISIKVVVNGDNLSVKETGEIVIDSKYILEIVRKIDAKDISIEIIDGSLIKIYGGNSEFKINCMTAGDYPTISFDSNGLPFTLSCDLFKQIVEETSFACSDSETRPVLTGVNMSAHDKVLKVNATDSYRLASKLVKIDQDSIFNITVPSKYLNSVYHSLPEGKDINLLIDNQKIIFSFDNILIQTRLLDDQFPDTSKLIPAQFSQVLKVSKRELKSAIDRTSFIKSDGKNIVKLSISSTSVEITANNGQSSSFESLTPISFEGNPFEISCSGKYLQDAVSSLTGDEVTLSFSGELRPMILTSKDDESLSQLISPVRTYR